MPRPWIVTPHRPIEKLEQNLWSVEADLPKGPMKRRMTIARLADGRLAFLNGVPLEELAMRELEAWGKPAFLCVPNGFHRLDIHAWKARYPELKVLCGAEARKRVSEKVPVDGGWADFPSEPGFSIEEVAGQKIGEPVGISKAPGRTTLVFWGDTVMNAPHVRGFAGLMYRVLGFSGALRVPRILRWIGVRDAQKLREHLLRLANLPDLGRIITSHGPLITTDAPAALRRAAEEL